MTLISKAIAVALIAGASALPFQSANAWGGPWGGNMFGMDMGQSYGYGNRWYPGGGGWGGPGYGGYGGYGHPGMYGGYGHPGMYGGYPYGYGYPTVVAPVAPATTK